MKDRKVLRYASHPKGHRSFFTEIINISETGMAFTVPYLDTPNVNEVIMVEFTPPNGTAVACYGKVLRVQNYTIIESDFFEKNCKLIGVKFIKLHDKQAEIIRVGLAREFKKLQGKFYRKQLATKLRWTWMHKKARLLTTAVVAIASAAGLAYWLF
ncbi:MAG: PilZ domain-containing protein [Bdellovibrionales bacterium]|nr:PilZ domain-containing protein [Bdellovibrionales bacterium]